MSNVDQGLQAMLLESSFTVTEERGERVASDYLPPRVSQMRSTSGFWN
jgi:hypothetical protein